MSTFGSLYRVTTFGESHCKAVGVIIDGCPPGLPLTENDVQPQLSRRRPGQSELTTPRDEKDRVTILSGTEMGFTLGTPIAMMVPNEDQRPHDYGEMDLYPRPSHADYTYLEKYGIKAGSGGGRSSARETIGRVAASAVAEKYITTVHGIEIVAFVASVGNVSMMPFDEPNGEFPEDPSKEQEWMDSWNAWWKKLDTVTRRDVDSNEVRCPDEKAAQAMRKRIVRAKEAQDSIGGTVVCVIRKLPTGLGEPCFDKLEAKLAHAMLSIPATKSFEIGSGLAGTTIPGHIHNDQFVNGENGKLRTTTNFSGGIQGGISNGENVYFKVGFKSVATISQAQSTAKYDGSAGVLEAKGRHDPCVLPRAVPIVESMATLVVMEALMQQNGRKLTADALVATGIQIPARLSGLKSGIPSAH
ncbi:hypothetical protein HDU78_009944 [Chytriomyces hyalinus]|nr:hypothetical protein HDU78_009944 [Chytriomyces hyalinus]KAJ3263321.1 hypothetical protein HDU77_010934 [Chytriomyces hyalinus]